MNNQQRKAKKVLLDWAKSQGHNVKGILHVQPRAFFIGYCAPASGVFKHNYLDSVEHLQDFTKKYPYEVITNFSGYNNKYFDTSLKEGDVCYTGYMVTDTSGIVIACAIPDNK
jgi:hypothetical protein